jgi:predicted DNA-binding protein YlxM (UPF0122 family)
VERIVEQAFLYDFYGELLTQHQKEIYEEVILNDCSLGEAAENPNISRQAIHDIIQRCDKTLMGYEQKLHLIKKFTETRERVKKIHVLAEIGREEMNAAVMEQIQQLAGQILEEL